MNELFAQEKLALDPITGQSISEKCWNGHHHDEGWPRLGCESADCRCLCHLNSYQPNEEAA